MIGSLGDAETFFEQAARGFFEADKAAFDARVRQRAESTQDELRNENPPPSDLPYRWSDDAEADARARGWYFENVVPKGSRGGRYQRSGKLAQQWEANVTTTPDSTAVELVNEGAGAFHVYDQQNPSHRGRWSQIDDQIDTLMDGMMQDVDAVFGEVRE